MSLYTAGMKVCLGSLIALALLSIWGVLGPNATLPAPSPAYDLVIRGGTIIDGTGKPAFVADLAVRGGKIAKVAKLENPIAREFIEAAGLVVAPGFVDAHNHTEFAIADPAKRFNEGFLRQGVTTIVGGADGTLSPNQISRLLEAYERNSVATNVAFYVGHNAIRYLVMAGERRAPTTDELEAMKSLVRDGMEAGALGFSSALMYEPGRHSKTKELIALAREAALCNGIYDCHVRDPGHALLESNREAIEVGERAGIPVKIATELVVGLENKGLSKQVVELIEAARARGVKVVTDQFPYDGAHTAGLFELIRVPGELRGQPAFDLAAALRDPVLRGRLKEASENGISGGFAWLKASGYSQMRITSSADYPGLAGKYLSQLATERNLSGFDLVCDLISRAAYPVGITLAAADEEDVREILKQPWNMIASDGVYSDGITPQGHPRSTGSFPRVLGYYVREARVLTLPEAIRKMTALPADCLGLHDRGRITQGLAADIVVFDPEKVSDRSTWEQPQKYAEGVEHLIVNGTVVLSNGKLTGQAPGIFLKRQR